MAWLGRHYADKIRAAVSLAMLQETSDEKHRDQGVQHITDAYNDCAKYAGISQKHYHTQMLARPGSFDWSEMLNFVKKDIALIASWKRN